MSARFASYAPIMLSVLRIVAALIFLEHGTQKFLGFPPGGPEVLPQPGEMLWWAGMIEMIPGFLLVLGLFTRTAAFLAAGEMAFAYWIGHFPRDLLAGRQWRRRGDPLLLHLPLPSLRRSGPWSLDAAIARRRPPDPRTNSRRSGRRRLFIQIRFGIGDPPRPLDTRFPAHFLLYDAPSKRMPSHSHPVINSELPHNRNYELRLLGRMRG